MVGPPLISLSHYQATNDKMLWIIPSLPIPCDGILVAWSYHVVGPGVFFADVWEKTAGATFLLIGKTRIEFTQAGAHVRITVICFVSLFFSCISN